MPKGQKISTAKTPPRKGGIVAPADTGTGSVSLTALGTAATENFDTLSNTAGSTTNTALPTGWYITEGGGGARDNEQYAVDTGSSTTGDTYSYGSAGSTDRALGELRSGTLIPLFGAKFTNNTGATVTSLDVSYTGEQWRFGGVHSTVADRLDFQYSLNATDLSTGTYLDANALDFNPPITTGTAGALDGNAAANRTAISSTITGLSIPNGATFFIRLNDVDATGADDGLAVDNFSITPQGGVVQPTLNIGDVTQAEGNSGTTNFNFTVSLTSAAGAGGVSFTVNTADGTATAPSDYTAIVNGSGSIAQGNTSTTVTVSVNGDTTPETNETFFVNISNITGATGGDTQGQGTITDDDVTLTPIYSIQGSGNTSPLVGQTVTTSGIVTGIKAGSSGGFFIQDPTGDGNTTTSDGIFVFTGSSLPAGAVIGNNVQVSGTVSEFIPSADPHQNPLTELSGTINVSVLSTGNTLPAAVTITAADTLVNNLNNLEKYEGMRVSVPSLTTISGTQGTITEASATVASNGVFYGVVTGVARPFREPGVNASDPLPAGAPANVPRFDENPERLRIDSDAQPGTTALDVTAGTVLTNVIGELDYAFRTYTIDPEAANPPSVGTLATATAVPVPQANELTVGSYNMERFFDTVNDGESGAPTLTATAFNNRLNKVSLAVRNLMRVPDVLGVEEMENLSTLQSVATKINNDEVAAGHANPNYQPYLVEGNDVGGIDVGFLVKSTRINVIDVTQIELPGCTHVAATCYTYTNPNTGQQELLNDRPPLVLRATTQQPNGGTFAFTVIVNHLRSLSGIDDETTVNGTGTEGGRVRAKRRAQAEFLANYIQSRQTNDPTERIISVGDYNAFDVNDGYVDVIGTIKGTPAPDDQVVLASSDLVNPDLTDLVDTLPAAQKYSYSFDGNAQLLDHVIVNPNALMSLNRFAYARNDADFPVKYYEDGTRSERESDHDMPVAFFTLGSPLVISEFRARGASGALDEYVELYNNSFAPLTVNAVDGTGGWTLAYTDSTGAATTIAATIPNGTVIPANGHYLIANSGYSLAAYAAADQSSTGDIPDDGALAIYQTANAANFSTANRLDAVSLNNGAGAFSSLFREGSNLSSPGANDGQYAFVRKLVSGTPQDTDNNAADFVFVSTDAGVYGGVPSFLGAPGPENSASPIQRNATIKASFIDPGCNATAVNPASPTACVRERNTSAVPNGVLGTLSIRRKFTNMTGGSVTRLRFRVVDVTGPTNQPAGTADLRVLTSPTIASANLSGGGTTTIQGLTLEEPPTQANGGGLNSSLSAGIITMAAPLASGASINVHFLLGVQTSGNYRFFVNVEALP